MSESHPTKQIAGMSLSGLAVVLAAVAMFVPWAETVHAAGEVTYRVWSQTDKDPQGIPDDYGWTSAQAEGQAGRTQIRIGGPLLAAAAATCLLGIFLIAGSRRMAAGSTLAVGAALGIAGIVLVFLGIRAHADALGPHTLEWKPGLWVAATSGAALAGACVCGFLMPAEGMVQRPPPGIKKAEPRVFLPGLAPAEGAAPHGPASGEGAAQAPAPGEPRTFTAMSVPGPDTEEEAPAAPAQAKPAAAKAGAKPTMAVGPAKPGSTSPAGPAKPATGAPATAGAPKAASGGLGKPAAAATPKAPAARPTTPSATQPGAGAAAKPAAGGAAAPRPAAPGAGARPGGGGAAQPPAGQGAKPGVQPAAKPGAKPGTAPAPGAQKKPQA